MHCVGPSVDAYQHLHSRSHETPLHDSITGKEFEIYNTLTLGIEVDRQPNLRDVMAQSLTCRSGPPIESGIARELQS
ncbi:hypothetical protein N7520_002915 [Penicillium odoratum]|uniref:uncharacterized protein n=1 Tax=Penicillium odoratum TaxID=1167516 RepID=UPI002546ACA3|nr:uncharacterized protein N7520_002915 [Penicillium odoratum]KAJ5772386.1 hypothetical protein N7520_002915 [Penicillium odoratum]